MGIIKMRNKKTKEIVDVYYIDPYGIATYFSYGDYCSNKSGWNKVAITKLLPADISIDEPPTSKTKLNKIKSRLTLIDAMWSTSDGVYFDHSHLEKAIEHEKAIMEREEGEIVM